MPVSTAPPAIFLPLGPRQPRRLLDIASPLPTQEGVNPLRWLDGVTFEPWPCRSLQVDSEIVCDDGSFAVVPSECVPWVTQTPFRIIDAMKGSLLDYQLSDVQLILSVRYEQMVSAAVARELLGGTGSSGMSLSSEAHAPNGAAFGVAATPVWNALAILEEEIAENLQGGVGIIHLSPGLLAQAVTSYGLSVNVNGMWETPAGNVLVSDAGYLNPTQPTGQASSSAATDWVYASGPVWFATTAPGFVGVGAETLNGTLATPWNRNTFAQFLAGYAILVFDPCPVTAVLASYALEG